MTLGVDAEKGHQEFLAGGGEMGGLVRETDWSATPIGPPSGWPQSLRTAVSICLASRFPMAIWWGPELIQIYNDGYRPVLGAKHPRSMGQRGYECWAEIWGSVGPLYERVRSTGVGTWSEDMLLVMERYGFYEETYFTFSYSAIRDESSGVGGVLITCVETTERVVGERRLHALRELAARSGEAKSAVEACRLAAQVLASEAADIPFALLYLVDDDESGHQATLAGSMGLEPGSPTAPERVDLNADDSGLWPLAEVVRIERSATVSGLARRRPDLPRGGWEQAVETALVLPLPRAGGEQPAGALVLGVTPVRPLDPELRGFFELVAQSLATAVANARAHEEERRRVEALAELDRAKTAFFSNVSHEFRTPLTLMLGPLDDLLATDLEPAIREQIDLVHRSGLRLLKLVNTLLDFSRIEAGRIEAWYQPTRLEELTADLASVFRSAVDRAGLELVVDCPPLPEPVYVDRGMWEKIVLNLLSNALKFTFDGGISVRLAVEEDEAVLRIADTGVGIAEDQLPRLFERFHRIRETRARSHEGSGIGLALVHELVHLHRGTIEVRSVEDEGTEFEIRLPLGCAHLDPEHVGPSDAQGITAPSYGAGAYVAEALRWMPEADAGEPAEETPGSWSGGALEAQRWTADSRPRPEVLIADDNADMRDYLERLLAGAYRVRTAADGRRALDSALDDPPELLISDVMMPGLDGFELLERLRADERTRDLPVILLSARAGEESRVEGLAAGADDYLVKPFSARELLARVAAHLELSRLRRSASQAQRLHAERHRQLASAALSIQSSRSLESMVEEITRRARSIVGADHAITSLFLGESERLSKHASREGVDEVPPDCSILQPLVHEVGRAVRLTRAELDERPEWRDLALSASASPRRGWLAAPLVSRDGERFGLIELCDKEDGEFGEEDESILVQLAQLAAVSIESLRLYEQTQAAVAGRDDVLAMVSHDLRNPLGSILSNAAILLTAPPQPERTTKVATRIERAARQMKRLIEDLLAVSALEAGQLSLELTLEDPVTVAEAACELLAPVADAQGVALTCYTEDAAPIEMDRERMLQVLQNLLSNGVDFTPEGGSVTLRVRDRGEALVYEIEDTGTGIDPDHLPHLFDRFWRARQQSNGGAGLGLAIVKGLVEAHGGSIEVESTLGEGSTFRVTLPRA